MMTNASATSGFTLVETSIAILVSVPILFAIVSTGDIVGNTVSTSEQVASVSDVLRSTARRVGQLVRPASVATLEGKEDAIPMGGEFTYEPYAGTINQYHEYYDPYAYYELTEPEPTYDPITGEVIEPPVDWQPLQNYVPRTSLRFQAATGTLSMNARELTPPRSIEFVRDAADPLNGIDDDGDGLVDEGRLVLNYDGVQTKIADGIESSTFVLEDRVVRFRLTFAKRDSNGRIHRGTIEQRFFLRND